MDASTNSTTSSTSLFGDSFLNFGLILIVASLTIFCGFEWIGAGNQDEGFATFLIHYGLFFLFFLGIMARRNPETKKRVKFSRLDYNILLLILGNISAYALNRILPVFYESVDWLTAYLVLLNGALLFFAIRKERAPDVVNHLMVAIIGSGVLFSIYQAIYIFPIYGFTVMSFWFFGISLHALIPIWYFFISIKVLKKYTAASNLYQYAIIAGITIPALLTMGFAFRFHQVNQQFQLAYAQEKSPFYNQDLPAWVNASKDIPTGRMTERVLKSGIYYNVLRDDHFAFGIDGIGRMNVKMKHDPLIVVGALVSGSLEIPRTERSRLLKTMYNQRHETDPRLWRGDNLSTSSIETNVRIYPAYRLAYTEKNLTINNNNSWKNNQQEALYSFYLPEGSVVTSASLWIEGEEQKAILTTRAKADSAYQTIVGRERRDPLLLHWQEGNRISVRVFPCTPKADRKFKIGITSPLEFDGEQLTYQNIDFEGPNWQFANETIRVKADDEPTGFSAALGFYEKEGYWEYEGRYRPDWTVSCDALPLNTTPFYFDGQAVQLTEWHPKLDRFQPKKIYLDLHNGWSKRTINRLMDTHPEAEFYVYNNRFIQLNSKNKKSLLNKLLGHNYSLFPFYDLPQEDDLLVVTHQGRLSPALDDLKKTEFYKKTSLGLSERENTIPVFHIGTNPTPYLKTLRELRFLHYVEGEERQLNKYLEQYTFPQDNEKNYQVYLRPAKVQLTKTPVPNPPASTAPDHLWRLYAYNNVMRGIGRDYFRKDQPWQKQIEEAEAAYVVTPISSLVTLETQVDYDRFDIKRSDKTLGNANLGGGGAVPEPYEWMLIIFGLLMAGWVWIGKFTGR